MSTGTKENSTFVKHLEHPLSLFGTGVTPTINANMEWIIFVDVGPVVSGSNVVLGTLALLFGL
jgi:hypothetical protein